MLSHPVGAVAATMLAHAEGFRWDEALMVLVPLSILAALAWLANSRAKKIQAHERGTEQDQARDTSAPSDRNLPTKFS